MVGWHHGLNGHEFEQTPGDSEGQGSLAGYSPHPPGDLPGPGIEPGSPALQAESLTSEPRAMLGLGCCNHHIYL